MKPEEIVQSLKEQYNRDLRKQIVKNILQHEKSNDKEAIQSSYNILNQIFSYVLNQLGWNITQDSSEWEDTPLQVMSEAFPQLKSTKWYQDQLLQVEQSIKLESDMLQK
ncbi:hypothetical protein [Sulfurimonas marina]|uniref:Uncharacterized protein n=1 Tax=Sulfurimonas marina TaxID=2590551 RepID=A0A7M1AVA2_9BACT|nr:hypothetical protein [Sulfurimonas marina]QOP41316.1 hypothetical protein FJR03_05990 [Sulfurimonas marina]